MLKNFKLETDRSGLFDITPLVEDALASSAVNDGLLLVSVPHSTAAVTVVSPWDVLGLEDVHDEICRLVPTRIDFKHQYDTPQDAAGHVKAAIVGHSKSFFIDGGKLGLGHSQKIYLWEFDGPRSRNIQIKVMKS
ncbi:secondary thiamine-phosphate synthase enzyme YjbQ [Rhizobium leguminosarum]|uniref:secondary thiamine-phosphate synthase enzyme YjbQ n=1 Tax=Rhizobium leguminosarum TaxID=384 RepID=UPI0004134348|nr:secondary thiamine-phosphate synthase enzyme YjbQ [Rhizobium leguminosarum]UIJ83207.1 secondary thiamine-phosphate synthase enzyme YjbQ [Rhizobium leguminosarum]